MCKKGNDNKTVNVPCPSLFGSSCQFINVVLTYDFFTDSGLILEEELYEYTMETALPNVFVKEKLIGGYDQVIQVCLRYLVRFIILKEICICAFVWQIFIF